MGCRCLPLAEFIGERTIRCVQGEVGIQSLHGCQRLQSALRAMHAPHGDRSIQGHHGRGRQQRKLIIQRKNAFPVRASMIGGRAMACGDACLQMILRQGVSTSGELQMLNAALDEGLISQAAVLLMQTKDVACLIGACRQARGTQ